MKVVGINGSVRKHGNTWLLIKYIFDILGAHGIETRLIQLSELEIGHCRACFLCKNKGLCQIAGDDFNTVLQDIKSSQGLILGSPVYSADVSGPMKVFLDRAAVVGATNPGIFKYKIGASIAAVRRAGGMTAIDTMNHFFLNKEMIIVGSTYWNMVYGNATGEVANDEEGMKNMKNLAENIVYLMNRL